MKRQKTDNHHVAEEQQAAADNLRQQNDACGGDNVADNGDNTADTMADDNDTQHDQAAEWRDKYLRLQAEFDNFRKRTLREKMELVQSGGADVLKAMLTVLDDVQRAVTASEKSNDIDALREGEKLVAQKFCDVLKQKGVTEIEAQGMDFDADLYEAVAKFPAPQPELKGKVIDVVQRGYKLGDKVLRYAKVVVGE